MENNFLKSGYVKDTIKDKEEYILGASPLPKVVLQADRYWVNSSPDFEPQRKKGVETFNCTTFNTLEPIETLMRRVFGNVGTGRNYSDRFLGIKAGTRPPGNSPHVVCETIRTCGLISEASLPFSDEIETVEDYYSFKGASQSDCEEEGKAWLSQFEFGHEWVFKDEMPLEEKQNRLLEGLQYSPIALSVNAWNEEEGMFFKNKFDNDNHWTSLVGVEENKYWLIKDSYEPALKKLRWNYDFGSAKRFHIAEKKFSPKLSFWERLRKFFNHSPSLF